MRHFKLFMFALLPLAVFSCRTRAPKSTVTEIKDVSQTDYYKIAANCKSINLPTTQYVLVAQCLVDVNWDYCRDWGAMRVMDKELLKKLLNADLKRRGKKNDSPLGKLLKDFSTGLDSGESMYFPEKGTLENDDLRDMLAKIYTERAVSYEFIRGLKALGNAKILTELKSNSMAGYILDVAGAQHGGTVKEGMYVDVSIDGRKYTSENISRDRQQKIANDKTGFYIDKMYHLTKEQLNSAKGGPVTTNLVIDNSFPNTDQVLPGTTIYCLRGFSNWNHPEYFVSAACYQIEKDWWILSYL